MSCGYGGMGQRDSAETRGEQEANVQSFSPPTPADPASMAPSDICIGVTRSTGKRKDQRAGQETGKQSGREGRGYLAHIPDVDKRPSNLLNCK